MVAAKVVQRIADHVLLAQAGRTVLLPLFQARDESLHQAFIRAVIVRPVRWMAGAHEIWVVSVGTGRAQRQEIENLLLDRIPGELLRHACYSACTTASMAPTRSTSQRTTSPTFSRRGGFIDAPVPS